VVTTNFIGGATDPEVVGLSDEELIRTVHDDLSKVLKIAGKPRCLPIQRWPRAIPQYTIGHAERVAKLESALQQHSGLWIVGNYLHGVSLGDCVKDADARAGKTLDWLAYSDR
jgi:oxygen-dependent protoporphyrinogen oxidase